MMPAKTDGGRQYRLRLVSPRLCWEQMRAKRVFIQRDLVVPGVSVRTAKSFLEKAMAAGLVRMKEPRQKSGGVQPAVYELVQDVGRRCPRFRKGKLDPVPQPFERMWAAMKPLRSGWTVRELASLTRSGESNTWNYVAALRRHGYLDTLAEAVGGAFPTEGRYRLKKGKNTGPDAPQALRGGRLWDPNLSILVDEVTE